jgi:hypothetical protein
MRRRAEFGGWLLLAGVLWAGSLASKAARGEEGKASTVPTFWAYDGTRSLGEFLPKQQRRRLAEISWNGTSLSTAQARDAAPTLDSAGRGLPVETAGSLADTSWSAAAPVPFRRNSPILGKRNPLPPRRSALLISLYVSHGLLQVLDARATSRALRTGSAQEGNPLMRPLAGQPAALVALKLGVAAGIIYGIDRLHRTHPRLAMISLGTINGGYLYSVQRSYRDFPTH